MWVYLYPSNTETPLKDAYIWIPFPTSIVLDKSSISLTTIWQTEQLTATIEPSICDKSITWSSDDTTIATVSTTWLVTCVTPWDCTIVATTVNGLTASCSVADSQEWQPWANTIVYYPLTASAQATDQSWNWKDLTVSGSVTFGIYGWVDCGYFSGWYLTWTVSNLPQWNTSRTISAWIYPTKNQSWIICWGASRQGEKMWIYYDWWIKGTVYYGTDLSSSTNLLNAWHHMVITATSSEWKLYIDWTLDTTLSKSDMNTSWTSICVWNLDWASYPFNNYLSNIIVEDTIWDATAVSDYYDQTKSLYGIS